MSETTATTATTATTIAPAPVSAVHALLDLAAKAEKPNYTQFQLRLTELGAGPDVYRDLRHQMEKRFGLATLDSDSGAGAGKSD